MGNIHVNMEFGPEVPKEMSFKDISYLDLWQPLCSADLNHLYNFGRRLSWGNYFEFGPVVPEEMSFKGIFIWSAGGSFVRWSVTICAIPVDVLFDLILYVPSKIFQLN